MTDPAPATTPDDDARQRKNIALGLILGGWCLAVIVVCIMIFSKYGFPKDPNAVRAGQDADKPAPAGAP